MRKALARTSSGFGSLFLGKKVIDAEILEELETLLLVADVGIEVTESIIKELTEQVQRNQLQDGAALHSALKTLLHAKLQPCEMPLNTESNNGPFVILVVGVNGVGKTTTIGKLAKKFQAEGKSVMLAACDTFRAAAAEQLQVWGARANVPVISGAPGADAAGLAFQALEQARAEKIDILMVDTAGRLQSNDNLMAELGKIIRVVRKLDETAPHESLLVLDATTGQNTIAQAEAFLAAAETTGLIMTKLDGTARGGGLVAIAQKLALPIYFIGVGEQADDLQSFGADNFARALVGLEDEA
jgi:fused signal recognition particle receptor